MITLTAQQLISGAGQDLTVLSLGQDLTGAEAEDALELLNWVVDALGIDRALLFRLVRTPHTLTSGTASYTLGAGATISLTPRPTRLLRAGLILDTSATTPTETPIDVLSDAEYAEWPQKTDQASHPTAVFYTRGLDASGFGTIYPLPIPDVGTTQLVLYTPGGAVPSFAALATTYAAAEGLALVLRTQFALQAHSLYPHGRLADGYAARAAYLKRTFQAAHLVVPRRTHSPLLTGRGGVSGSDFDAGQF